MKTSISSIKIKVVKAVSVVAVMLAAVPAMVLAQTKPAAEATASGVTKLSIHLENPLGVNTVQDLLLKVISAMTLIASPVIVIMFIYSGFLFVQSANNEETKKKAKNTLLYTLIGAAVILGAKAIALAVQNTVIQF